MTHLELIAEVGGGNTEIVDMYLGGRLTRRELSSVLGKNRAALVEQYVEGRQRERGTVCPLGR